MKVAVFHGSPRRGNTYRATGIFIRALSQCGAVQYTEFFLPHAMPEFCTGCQLCLGGPHDRCPHARAAAPVLDAVLSADALIFTTPHHGASMMSSGMKNLLDHLDFLAMIVAPRPENFRKKAFILSTGSGSAAAIRPIRKFLKHWGINRVYSVGLRMFTDQWGKMPEPRRLNFEKRLQRSARRFYNARKGFPYLSTIFLYHMSKFIIRKYIGKGNYPYEYWAEKGYFAKCPL